MKNELTPQEWEQIRTILISTDWSKHFDTPVWKDWHFLVCNFVGGMNLATGNIAGFMVCTGIGWITRYYRKK